MVGFKKGGAKRGAKKLPQESVERRLAAIMGVDSETGEPLGEQTIEIVEDEDGNQSEIISTASSKRRGFLTHMRQAAKSEVKRNYTKQSLDVVKMSKGGKGTTPVLVERVVPESKDEELMPPTEEKKMAGTGLRLLRRAIKDQSHAKELKHHERHDYEYRLRRVATAGVVRLFNALTASQKVGEKTMERTKPMDEDEMAGEDTYNDDNRTGITEDKARDQKLTATRETFLSTLKDKGANKKRWD